jgi:nucleoid DNA-binding protein
MLSPPRDQVESVLAELIRDSLSRRESVHVPGLGTFTVRHASSSIEKLESGEIKMTPPVDEVVFTAEP